MQLSSLTLRPALITLLYVFKASLLLLPSSSAVRCYCTEDHCYPYGYCEADWCLVGIRRSTNEVIRTCGGADEGAAVRRLAAGKCRRGTAATPGEAGDWSDLCACTANFCNTFAYLRMQIGAGAGRRSGAGGSSRKTSSTSRSRGGGEASDLVVFGRVDVRKEKRLRSYDEDNGDALLSFYRDKPIAVNRTRFLTILLVVVPLTIGGAAVLIITANYYCQLC